MLPLRFTKRRCLPFEPCMARSNSAVFLTGCRLTSWITSPRRSPASDASLEGSTFVTTTPFVLGERPSSFAACASRFSTETPESALLGEPLPF